MNKALKGIVPEGYNYIKDNIINKGNIVGVAQDKAAWAKGLNLPKQAEYTFFAGCGYQFMRYAEGMMDTVSRMESIGLGMDKGISLGKTFGKAGIDITSITAKLTSAGKQDPYTKCLTSAVNVLRKLTVDIGYLYEDEPCCGSPIYYAGFVDKYVENAKKNFELLKSLRVKKIIGIIPACTFSLRSLYPKFIEHYDFEVKHVVEIVAEKLRQTKMKPKLHEKLVLAYHDPCQLSRYLNIINEPREIMSRIEGLELREPKTEQCKQWSTCCGGGGLEMSHPELSQRLAMRRLEELLATGASVIATSCPSCMMQLTRAARHIKANVKVIDLLEILEKALQ